MSATSEMSRRAFLKTGSTAATGLVIGFYWPRTSAAAAVNSNEATPPVLAPNAWLRIDANGQVTVLVEKSELGQGVFTSIPMILAEELEVEWSAIHVEQAPAQPEVYHDLTTGGSGSVWGSWTPLREAAAKARELFVQAAARKWRVRPEACRAAKGSVFHPPTGRRLSYGQLVETVAQSRLSTDGARLKDRKDYRIIGRAIPRTDVPAKVDGSAVFGLDVTVPGMLYAVIARCPTFGGKVASFDATAAKAVPGVRHVIQIEPLARPQNTAGGVAVVADSTWAAIQGRNALKIAWDKGASATESTATLRQLAEAQSLEAATFVGREDGDARAALQGAAKTIEAVYELPFEAHATMEPMNCTAHVREEHCEMWVATQWPDVIRDELVRLSGLPWPSITVHNALSGGGFGRRAQWDFAGEAWQVSKAVNAPVKVVWTREDDMQHDFYRQASYHRMQGGLAGGKPTAWTHRIVSTSIREVFDSAERLKDPRRVAAQEMSGATGVPYAIPHVRVDFAPLKSRVPRAWWRSVNHSFNAFAVESFVDELAAAADKDPYRFRLELLGEDRSVRNPMSSEACDTRRLRGVLQLAALKAAWDKPLPKGRGRGIACHFSFQTYVAQVAEVSQEEDGNVRVHRVVAAVDCGTVVNPDGARAQMEGAIIFGLSAALKGQITVQDGAVQQSNFHDYPVLRMEETPVIEVHLVPSTERPSGMGEPGVPPIAPAVANALFAATGRRLRKLPLVAG